MPTPFLSRQIGLSSPSDGATAATTIPDATWRCTRCDKLLGIRRDGRLHIRFARGHEYLVGFPIVATCRGCGTLNQANASAR